MALTATQTQVVNLITGMFNAAPGKAIMESLAAQVDAGKSIDVLAQELAASPVFTSLYPTTDTNEAFAKAWVAKLFGGAVTDAASVTAAEAFIAGLINGGASRADAMKAGIDLLVSVDNADPIFGKASAQLENKMQAAANYSETESSNDLAVLTGSIASVTDDKLTIPPVAPVAGKSILLTDKQDDLAGTTSDDTFRATSSTLQLGDNLDGGAGTDTLSIAASGTGTVLSGFDLKSIEAVEIESNATGDQVIDFSDADAALASISSTDTEGAALTIRDLQSSSIAVTIKDTDENHTIDYDEQALSGAANELKLTLNEVRTGATITANDGSVDGNLETLSITTTGIASSFVDLVSGTDLKTLNIAGDKDLTIVNTLDTGITSLDASTQTGKLSANVADTATDLTVKLGTNDDQVNFGDNLQTADTVSGGTGKDTVSVNYSNTGNRSQTMSGVETLNAVFLAAAEFDGTNVTDLETINLGLVHGSDDAAAVASTSNADFNDLKNTTKTVNVHHNQLDVELDYDSGADTDLTVNGQTDTRSVTFAGAGNNSLNVINVAKVAINNVGDNNLDLTDGVSLDASDTTTLSLSTAKQAGNLIISDDAAVSGTAFDNGNSVESVSITALDGDILASGNGTSTAGSFMDAAQALQTVAISSTNADLIIGQIGNATAAADLESVTISNTNSASLDIGLITATGANINNVTITTSDKNTVASAASGNVNVVLDGITTTKLDQLTVNANDGGHAAIDALYGTLDNYTVTGTGNVFITAAPGNPGAAVGAPAIAAAIAADTALTMSNIGTATGYTGTVTIAGGSGIDALMGTTANDVISTGAGNTNTVNGGGGNDNITLDGAAGVDTVTLGTTQADADIIVGFKAFGADKIKNTVTLLNEADATITDAGAGLGATIDAVLAANAGVSGDATVFVLDDAAFDLSTGSTALATAANAGVAVTAAQLAAVTTAAQASINATSTATLDARLLATETVLFVFDNGADSAVFSFNNSTIGGNRVDDGELVLIGMTDAANIAIGDIII